MEPLSGSGRRTGSTFQSRRPKRDGATAFALLFERLPTALELAKEPQGEALCFSADGRALLTISEKTPTTLYEVRSTENGPEPEP